MRASELRLVELLAFEPPQGRIRFGDHRMLLWDADAFGNLRRELIENLGVDTARGILRRFGFANGYRDAQTTRALAAWPSDAEWWLTCPALQAHEGKVRPEVGELHIDRERGEFSLAVTWHGSYEAEQHQRVEGVATAPACWTLAGYASGFSTAVMGQEVFVVEHECVAMGHAACRVRGRTRPGWGAEADAIAAEYSAPALALELEARAAELRATALLLAQREDELARLRAAHTPVEGFVTHDPAMQKVLELVTRVAQVDATVLITGESGTGKERIARLVHARSPRRGGELIAVNCGALPEALLESELFGHVKGAFTGAATDKPGLFEAARGGTIFLDEIGETTPATQVKLLRVLQEREIRRVGATASVPVDVRVVAATNRGLEAMVAAGTFRADLYYRLKVVTVDLPGLRERIDDILPLARHFLARVCAAYGQPLKTLSAEAAAMLRAYAWPGNVRQLEHAIEHGVVLAGDEPKLAPGHLPPELARTQAVQGAQLLEGVMTLDELERRYTLLVLERQGGSRAATARALGIGTNTLWRKLKAWGVPGAAA